MQQCWKSIAQIMFHYLSRLVSFAWRSELYLHIWVSFLCILIEVRCKNWKNRWSSFGRKSVPAKIRSRDKQRQFVSVFVSTIFHVTMGSFLFTLLYVWEVQRWSHSWKDKILTFQCCIFFNSPPKASKLTTQRFSGNYFGHHGWEQSNKFFRLSCNNAFCLFRSIKKVLTKLQTP